MACVTDDDICFNAFAILSHFISGFLLFSNTSAYDSYHCCIIHSRTFLRIHYFFSDGLECMNYISIILIVFYMYAHTAISSPLTGTYTHIQTHVYFRFILFFYIIFSIFIAWSPFTSFANCRVPVRNLC